MDVEQAKEFQQLTQRAHTRLFANSWTLRLGVQHTFENSSVVGLSFDKPGSIVTRTWYRSKDLRKLACPVERRKHPATLEPTISEMSVNDTDGAGAAALRRLDEVRFVALPASRRIVLDGTRYSIHVRDASIEMSLSWSNQAPEEWRTVSDWFDQTWAAICGVLQFDPINQEPAPGL